MLTEAPDGRPLDGDESKTIPSWNFEHDSTLRNIAG